MFPLFLKLAGRLGVVIGGGPVGRRKARSLVEGGARVRLVCLEPRPKDETVAALEWRQEAYHPRHLAGAVLVFGAATAEVNRQVVADAGARGLWVNSATEPDGGDFFLPAVARRGPLTVAVGTDGTAPALAGAVRLLLEEQLDETFGSWAALLAELRPVVHAATTDPVRRREVLRRLCQAGWLERLRREGVEPVRTAMLREIEGIA
jgi:precorrin-2 dehydrogenase/sirohydrochlorin ferrochelatase